MLTIGSSLTLDILVENQGHHTGSSDMQDIKGIVGNVTINKEILTSWEMYPLNLDNITGWEKPRTHSTSKTDDAFTPTFYSGFIYPTPDGIPKDTFMRFRNWHKVEMKFVCILTKLTDKYYVLEWSDTAQLSTCTLKPQQVCEPTSVKQTISSQFFQLFLSWEV